jgi:hypothetical protein
MPRIGVFDASDAWLESAREKFHMRGIQTIVMGLNLKLIYSHILMSAAPQHVENVRVAVASAGIDQGMAGVRAVAAVAGCWRDELIEVGHDAGVENVVRALGIEGDIVGTTVQQPAFHILVAVCHLNGAGNDGHVSVSR